MVTHHDLQDLQGQFQNQLHFLNKSSWDNLILSPVVVEEVGGRGDRPGERHGHEEVLRDVLGEEGAHQAHSVHHSHPQEDPRHRPSALSNRIYRVTKQRGQSLLLTLF